MNFTRMVMVFPFLIIDTMSLSADSKEENEEILIFQDLEINLSV